MISGERINEIREEIDGFARELSRAAQEAEEQEFDDLASYLTEAQRRLDAATGSLDDAESNA